MATGRNEPCSCGSGKKAKHCCGAIKKSFISAHGPSALVAIVLAIGASAIIAALKRDNTAPPASPRIATQQVLPATPAPAAPASGPQTALTPPTAAATPPGPAPAGKVWSAEHGHWHDTAPVSSPVRLDVAGGATPAPTSPTGELPPSPGMVWSEEHKHWHFPETDSNIGNVRVFPRGAPPAPPAQQSPKPQPSGPAPEGMVWSAEHGHWHKKNP